MSKKPLAAPTQGKSVRKRSTVARDMSKVRELGFTTFAFKFSERTGDIQRTRYVYASTMETATCRKSLLMRGVTFSKLIDGGAFDFDDEVSNAVTTDDASCTSSNVEDDVLSTKDEVDEVLLVNPVDDLTETDLTEILPDATCVDGCDTEEAVTITACDIVTNHSNIGIGNISEDTNLTDMDLMSLLDFAYE